MAPTGDALLSAYRRMRTIRAFEDRLHLELASGRAPAFAHLSAGGEACAVGVCSHVEAARDAVTSTHRAHGHAIALGCDVGAVMKELYGKRGGLCGGKGGSMHLADLERGFLGANGIVGAGVPLAAGAALSAKTRGDGGVAVAFLGDGAANQGVVSETLNLAAVWCLPLVFVLEDNGYAAATGSAWATGGGDLAQRARGFGVPAEDVDGLDYFAVHEAAGRAVAKARAGDGPRLLNARIVRRYGHSSDDADAYRSPEERAHVCDEQDCLLRFRDAAGLPDADLARIDAEAEARIDRAVRHAEAAPAPDPADLLTDVA